MDASLGTILTIIAILSAVVTIFGTVYKLRSEKRNLDENTDKTQTEVSSLLAESTRLLLEPMKQRIVLLERENKFYMAETESLKEQVIKIERDVEDLKNKLMDAENYIIRLSHQLLSFEITPIPRTPQELKNTMDLKG